MNDNKHKIAKKWNDISSLLHNMLLEASESNAIFTYQKTQK